MNKVEAHSQKNIYLHVETYLTTNLARTVIILFVFLTTAHFTTADSVTGIHASELTTFKGKIRHKSQGTH